MRLIPRETKFFDMFEEIAGNVVEGAQALNELLHNYDYERMPAPSSASRRSSTTATT